MPLGILVEDVEGLKDTANVLALALVWENRIMIDARLRKTPRARRNILQHERRHIMNVWKRGMTRHAGRVNFLIEMEYGWTVWALLPLVLGSLLFGPWMAAAAVVVWINLVFWWNRLWWQRPIRDRQV